jgi:phosphoserine phosphatase RsbU/P
VRRLAFLLLSFVLPLGAQVRFSLPEPVHLVPGMTLLSQGWRTHAGDSPAWAAPGFDDSAWPAISLARPNHYAGWRWYRLCMELPAQHPRLALLLTGGSDAYEVYVNGQRLPGPEIRSPLVVSYAKSRVVPLPSASGPTEIALRTHIPVTSMFLADRGAFRVAIGTVTAIQNAHGTEQSRRLDYVLLGNGVHLLLVLAGLVMLTLFWYERDHREYLWLGVYLLLAGGGTIFYELVLSGFLPFSFNWFIAEPSFYIGILAQIEFTFSFVGQRVTRRWRIYESILLIPPGLLLVPAWVGFLSRGLFNVDEVLIVIPAAIGLPVLLLLWYRRGNREAGWLILPSLLPMLTVALNDFGIVGDYLHWPRLAALSSPLSLGLFSVQPFDIGDLVFLLAIGIVMFFRFTRVSREQARAAAELEAGRRVQALLLRSALASAPAFRIDTVYRPAHEVGGDFFHTAQIGDSARIVVGDVSGKGLGAAMLVSAIIGALDTLHGTAPAEVLRALNDLLLSRQQGGFATCLCAALAPDGRVTLANAGHLPPYCKGQELPLAAALPLGISADAEYAETTHQLAPCDLLTFVSDGVVEAQNATGELFGFERTRQYSRESAERIAEAAQTFGQQDDITVLTLQFAPAEVARA